MGALETGQPAAERAGERVGAAHAVEVTAKTFTVTDRAAARWSTRGALDVSAHEAPSTSAWRGIRRRPGLAPQRAFHTGAGLHRHRHRETGTNCPDRAGCHDDRFWRQRGKRGIRNCRLAQAAVAEEPRSHEDSRVDTV